MSDTMKNDIPEQLRAIKHFLSVILSLNHVINELKILPFPGLGGFHFRCTDYNRILSNREWVE